MTAPPPEILRSTFFLRHFGHTAMGAAVIEWNSSNSWAQARQMYS